MVKPKLREVLSTEAVRHDVLLGKTAAQIWRDHAPQFGMASVRHLLNVMKTLGEFDTPSAATVHSRNPAPPPPIERLPETHERKGENEWSITKTMRSKSPEDVLKACQVNTDEWEIERSKVGKYEIAAVPRPVGSTRDGWSRASTELMVEELWTIQVWLRRKVQVVAVRQEIESLIASAAQHAPHYPVFIRQRNEAGLLWEISPYDVHFGKLAWSPETGWGNYDINIARQSFESAIEALMHRTRHLAFDQILVVLGNDMLNCDNREGMTTGGTPQRNDSRYPKVFECVRQSCVWMIDVLLERAPVVAKMVPGNHDTNAVFHLGDSLKSWYRQCADVTIDNSPNLHKYHAYGKCLIGLTHGDKGKKVNLPLLMAVEQPHEWEASDWREWHLGHWHKLMADESFGVRVRVLPSLCPPDDWHAAGHMVGNIQSTESFVWSADEGVIGTVNYNMPRRQGQKGDMP